MNFNEEEFKYLLESGELDKISSDSETETSTEEESN